MREQGSGAIVNVSSGLTKMVLTGSAGYSSSKAALNHLSLVAREELAPNGISVSVIYPTSPTPTSSETRSARTRNGTAICRRGSRRPLAGEGRRGDPADRVR